MSRHVKDPFYNDVAHARIEEYKGSEIYGGRKRGFCGQDGMECERDSELCHRVSPDWMFEETARWKAKYPESFRESGLQ